MDYVPFFDLHDSGSAGRPIRWWVAIGNNSSKVVV